MIKKDLCRRRAVGWRRINQLPMPKCDKIGVGSWCVVMRVITDEYELKDARYTWWSYSKENVGDKGAD